MSRSNSRVRAVRASLASALLGIGLSALALPALSAGPGTQAASKPTVAAAQPIVQIEAPWIRPTVKGQTATGAFMGLKASHDLVLLGFSTPVAAESELHEMIMDGDVMRMRAIESLPLPADQSVALKPGAGGKHLMLMGLKRQLKAGDAVKLRLKLRGAEGKVFTQEINVPVRAGTVTGAAPAASAQGHDHHHGHDHQH